MFACLRLGQLFLASCVLGSCQLYAFLNVLHTFRPQESHDFSFPALKFFPAVSKLLRYRAVEGWKHLIVENIYNGMQSPIGSPGFS